MRAYERFLEYVKYPTMSDETTGTTPSTEKQRALAERLALELREMGVTDAFVDEYGYVYAHLKSNTKYRCNRIGFIAHLDTSSEASDENIRPRVVKYEGGDILLNGEKGIYLSPSDYPYLYNFVGESLIVTDGTTLLGADDKAGVAEIMTALSVIIEKNIPHGDISVAFTPDEEIGEGADHFNVALFGADYAYTVDGGALGEVEYENFNAASARVEIHGVSIHPGAAKGKMKNAARIATEFDGLLPTDEIPELTSGYEGFHHLLSVEGGCELARLSYIIRDHDMKKFTEKKEGFLRAAKHINDKYGDGVCVCELRDSYFNMREMIEPNMFIIERATNAMRYLGIQPVINPIRGGTDGARLSFMGLPCPNLCTGGMNFHSRFEFVSVDAMDKITELIVTIISDAVGEGYHEVVV